MSEYDDIRRAMEELSNHPPQRDRKPGVHDRIAVVRRRRQFSSGLALSLVTLVAGITLTSFSADSPPPKDGVFESQSELGTPSPVASPELPTPTPTPSAPVLPGRPNVPAPGRTAKSAVGTPLPATVPAASSSVNRASPGPNAGVALPTLSAPAASPTTGLPNVPTAKPTPSSPRPEPSVTPSATGGSSPTPSGSTSTAPSTSGSATASPGVDEVLNSEITAETLADGSTAPETVVRVRLHGKIRGSLDNVTVWFTKIHRVGYADSVTPACALFDGQLRDIDETFTFRTRYRAAGAEQIDVTATALDQACVRTDPQRQWAFSTAVTIPVGSSLSNGPRLTTISLSTPQVTEARVVTVSAAAKDPDGFVNGFTVDWGTGAPVAYPGGNGANCSAGEAGGVFWPAGDGSGVFTSPTMAAGTYTVTVTATATGCDGKDPQSARETITVVVP